MSGGKLVIVGHSERRADHGETDALVRAKAEAGLAGRARSPSSASARPRRSGEAGRDLRACSTGSSPARCPTGRRPANLVDRLRAGLGDRHRADAVRRMTSRRPMPIYAARLAGPVRRRRREAIRILYGGSVKPANAARDPRARRRRRRAGRRRQPQGRGFPGDYRRLRLTPRPRAAHWQGQVRSCTRRPASRYRTCDRWKPSSSSFT